MCARVRERNRIIIKLKGSINMFYLVDVWLLSSSFLVMAESLRCIGGRQAGSIVKGRKGRRAGGRNKLRKNRTGILFSVFFMSESRSAAHVQTFIVCLQF